MASCREKSRSSDPFTAVKPADAYIFFALFSGSSSPSDSSFDSPTLNLCRVSSQTILRFPISIDFFHVVFTFVLLKSTGLVSSLICVPLLHAPPPSLSPLNCRPRGLLRIPYQLSRMIFNTFNIQFIFFPDSTLTIFNMALSCSINFAEFEDNCYLIL